MDLLVEIPAVLLSPLWFIPLAVAVKISSRGPVLFRQTRTGYMGKEFECLKFRTMHLNDDADSMQASEFDTRITKIGKFLRKTSLDELPQFFNVLKGDMAIVGPRPHMIKHTADYMLRHLVKPGLTGWAQANGLRGETKELWQMGKRVEYDIHYVERWSVWLDFKIMFLTFGALHQKS